jgi:hypothetical protein
MTARTLTISVAESEPDTARFLRQLQDDLRRAGIACTPVEARPEPMAKSGGELLSLLVGGVVSAAGLRAVSQVLVAAVRRSGKRRVEVRWGDDVLIIDGASARDGHKALDGFLARGKAVDGEPVVTVDEA